MASSSIRQPDDVLVSVASPAAPGTRSVGPSAAWKRSAEVLEPNTLSPIATAAAAVAAAPAKMTERGAHRGAPSLRLDPRPQGRRRLDLGRCATHERDGALLLGKQVRELRMTPRPAPRARRGAPARATRPRAPPARRSPDRRLRPVDGVSSTRQSERYR